MSRSALFLPTCFCMYHVGIHTSFLEKNDMFGGSSKNVYHVGVKHELLGQERHFGKQPEDWETHASRFALWAVSMSSLFGRFEHHILVASVV